MADSPFGPSVVPVASHKKREKLMPSHEPASLDPYVPIMRVSHPRMPRANEQHKIQPDNGSSVAETSPFGVSSLQDFLRKSGIEGLTEPSQWDNAGLPFVSMRGVRNAAGVIEKVEPVYRGSKRARLTLDPAFYDTNDTLGWMTHAAENPEYASEYSIHGAKGMSIPDPNDVFHSSGYLRNDDLKDAWGQKLSPFTRQMVIRNENTFDAINPNPDDLSAALAAVPAGRRKNLIKDFKDIQRTNNYSPSEDLAKQIIYEFNNPRTFRSSPFDAVRYSDAGQPSWAFPEHILNQTVTPGGVPINKQTVGRTYPPVEKPRFIAGPEGIADNSHYSSQYGPTNSDVVKRLYDEVAKVKVYSPLSNAPKVTSKPESPWKKVIDNPNDYKVSAFGKPNFAKFLENTSVDKKDIIHGMLNQPKVWNWLRYSPNKPPTIGEKLAAKVKELEAKGYNVISKP